ncbi:MAG: glycosyltransferase family 4 protein [Anaerolineaceae bacterium]
MRIGHISFRLAGTDGVSLETAKIVDVLRTMGHSNYYFAGELDPPIESEQSSNKEIIGSMCVPQAHFNHPKVLWITDHAFGNSTPHADLFQTIEDLTQLLEKELFTFIHQYKIELLTVQNVFALPMNLSLSIAIYRVLKVTGIPAIAHNHDFYWEREKYLNNCVGQILEEVFPPQLPNLKHMVINSQAQSELKKRGFQSTIMPNIFDFDAPLPGIDDFNLNLKSELGLNANDLFFLQPTRVIPRKGIELAIELVHQLSDLPIKLIISHNAELNTLDYLSDLFALAALKKVDLRYLPVRFLPYRVQGVGIQKKFSLWDAYIFTDFVTYPSLYEGFGNAILETIYFHKPFLVNRYKIYRDDIEPIGIKAVQIDGEITEQAVEEVRELLTNPSKVDEITSHNFNVARNNFSYQTAQTRLEKLFKSFNS